MSDKKENKEEVFELSNLFTTQRIDEGLWFEPYSNQISLGIKFKVIGVSSPKVIKDYTEYQTKLNLISVKDGVEAALKEQYALTADFVPKLIADVQTVDGRKIVINGENMADVNGAMKDLFMNNNLIAEMILNFASSDFNYIIQD